MVKAQFLAPLFLLAFLTAAVLAKADTPITSCGTYSTANAIYVLQNDIVNASGSCIILNANNVTLDCSGHTIDGTSSGYGFDTAIRVGAWYECPARNLNTTIKNCVVKEWTTSILMNSRGSVSVYDTTLLNGAEGIHITEVYGAVIRNVTIRNMPYWGIASHYGETCCPYCNTGMRYSVIDGAVIENCGVGAYRIDGDGNIIKNSKFTGNSIGVDYGIVMGIALYNNYFDNNVDVSIIDCWWNDRCVWNTTRQSGERIYGVGNEIGGNYWNSYSAYYNGSYADKCVDSEPDGFCDLPYDIEERMSGGHGNWGTDYLPLSSKFPTTTTTTIPTIPPCQVCDISNLPIGSMGLGAIPGAFVCGMLNILFCVPILFALVILGMVGIWYWRKLRG